MFTPKRAPLKEGRSHPGLPYSGAIPTTRRFSPRQIAMIVGACLCLPLLFYVLQGDSTGLSSRLGGANSRSGNDRLVTKPETGSAYDSTTDDGIMKVNIPSAPKDLPIVKDESPEPKVPVTSEDVPKKVDTPKAEKPKIVDADEDDDEDIIRRPKPKQSTSGSKQTDKYKHSSAAEKWTERPTFEKALTAVVTALPDEVHMRELTREVDSTGKDRLREMGLRTRAYKKYFELWEALHLMEDEEGGTYVRDDVVQYLRSHIHTDSSGDSSADGGLAGMTLAQTIRSYEAYRSFMNNFANLLFPWTMPYFSDHMSLHAHFKKGGRGIVLTAGDDQAPYLLATIWTYRQLGCNLPIEVMYLGDQDLGEDYRAELEALDGVVTRDIAQMVRDEGWKLAGWAAKPFAILLSSFREVIFIDADSLFFRDPSLLFEEPGYKDTGALFFRDRKIMPESKKRWLQQILPKPIPKLAKQSRFWTGESGHMQESGVVVVDKWQHFIPLLLITRMNGPDRDGNKEKGKIGVYDMVYGDKETFWVGWLLSGDERYHFHEGDAGIMGVLKETEEDHKENQQQKESDPNDPDAQHILDDSLSTTTKPDNYTICAPQLLHLDASGNPYWFNGWILANKFVDRSKKTFASFDYFIVEPRENRDPTAWQLAESNMCCLTADEKHDFSVEDRKTLNMILGRAKDIGAYGNQR